MEEWAAHFPEITEQLNSVPQVRWDRFVVYLNIVRAYGWLDRWDGRADFVLADFYSDAPADPMVITSSPTFRWREYAAGEHIPCERIEEWMPETHNVVKLGS